MVQLIQGPDSPFVSLCQLSGGEKQKQLLGGWKGNPIAEGVLQRLLGILEILQLRLPATRVASDALQRKVRASPAHASNPMRVSQSSVPHIAQGMQVHTLHAPMSARVVREYEVVEQTGTRRLHPDMRTPDQRKRNVFWVPEGIPDDHRISKATEMRRVSSCPN